MTEHDWRTLGAALCGGTIAALLHVLAWDVGVDGRPPLWLHVPLIVATGAWIGWRYNRCG